MERTGMASPRGSPEQGPGVGRGGAGLLSDEPSPPPVAGNLLSLQLSKREATPPRGSGAQIPVEAAASGTVGPES